MKLQWYVARTRPQGEYFARDNLRSGGVETYLPCVRTRHPRRGHEDAPLFPGYLFLHCDLETQGSGLRLVPQLRGLVAFEGSAPSVPDDVIAQLADQVERMNGFGGWLAPLQPGDTVQVAVGHTPTMATIVSETRSPKGRVRVLLDFLGRQVYADVPANNVERPESGTAVAVTKDRAPRRTRGRGRWIGGAAPRPGQHAWSG